MARAACAWSHSGVEPDMVDVGVVDVGAADEVVVGADVLGAAGVDVDVGVRSTGCVVAAPVVAPQPASAISTVPASSGPTTGPLLTLMPPKVAHRRRRDQTRHPLPTEQRAHRRLFVSKQSMSATGSGGYPGGCQLLGNQGRTAVMVRISDLLYGAYERRLTRKLPKDNLPRHVGVMLDGNRRWAKERGADTASGHQAGADNIEPLLGWCEEVGVEVVTLWLLSTDNLSRSEKELRPLLGIIESVVTELAATRRWRIHPVGALDMLPERTATVLKQAAEDTVDVGGMLVNVAVPYGGRREIADAVRSMLLEHAAKGATIEELAQDLDVDHIAQHLYTKGQPDPDLVIRTSGEQRLGGFLLWQSAHSEFYFCEAYWPDFRKVDFLRALRAYAERDRRYGS